MIPLNIHLVGDGAFPDDKGLFVEGALTDVARLSKGTGSGRSSVMFRIVMPNGKIIYAQTTMRLFQSAASAFKIRDEMEGVPE